MTKRYVTKNTAKLYTDSTGSSFSAVLIYGDEVDATGTEQNNRSEVNARSYTGWIKKDDLQTNPVLEIYFIDVGQGDSTFIVTPSRKKILVDGGRDNRALHFLIWKYRLDKDENPAIDIDLLVQSHGDEDHIKGLTSIISHPKFKVKKIIHSGIAVFKSGQFDTELGQTMTQNGTKYLQTSHDKITDLNSTKLSPNFLAWHNAIINEANVKYNAVDSTTGLVNIDPEVSMEVLGPRMHALGNNKVYRWFGDKAHTINGHSVVLRLTYNNIKLLLAGDLNIPGEENLLEDPNLAAKMDAHVLKAPHHGSHEYVRNWLDAVNPQISVISSGDEPDYGHPRANFIADVGNASRIKSDSLVFSTEIAATFVQVNDNLGNIDLTEDEKKGLTQPTREKIRGLFKRKLNGMINVRTDGNKLYAARRISHPTSWWEHYGPFEPAPRSINL